MTPATTKTYTRPDPDWWRGATIYQIYPRSFADSNGDGVGDLKGITARLDYVASLGVDGIWLSPFFTSPMADFGYDVSDYCDVDPVFGTLADFDALMAKAHGLGLKVMVDLVFAHTSDQHDWFAESRADKANAKADWYVWADPKRDGTPPNNWQSVFGGPAWTWDARRGQYYMHNFLKEQPQLNVHNPTVQAALCDVAAFWMERGVDGFRLDAINFGMHDPKLRNNPVAPADGKVRTRPFDFQLRKYNQSRPEMIGFVEHFRQFVEARGGAFSLAEIGTDDGGRDMKAYTAGGARFNSAYSFAFLHADQLTPLEVKQNLATWSGKIGEGWPSWAFSNHDAPRWLSRWAPAEHEGAFAQMVMLLFTCLRGNLILWQGEELGLTQVDIPFEQLKDPEAIANWPLIQSRDGARTPFVWEADAPNCGFSTAAPWLPIGPDHPPRAVDQQEGDAQSLLNLTRRLLAMRKANPALALGRQKVLIADEGVLLVLESRHGDAHLVSAFNFGANVQDWSPPYAGNWTVIDQVNGAAPGQIGAYGGIIFKRG